MQKKYRADIDGLRAIAVLAVIFYHAFPNKFIGGFIGVDIFFVISGYLITSIIISELADNNFRIIGFYLKRIRRIFPALICMSLTVFVCGWFALMPDEFKSLGKHMIGGSLFISNFILWNEIGYFDVNGNSKPLMHLWSLSIEEQFYFAWPLVFLLLRNERSWRIFVLCIIFFSFGANVLFSILNERVSFYMPFTRFWEIGVGAFLAIFYIKRKKILLDAFSLFGFSLILVGLLVIDLKNPYPGWQALLPVIGASLVIASGPEGFVNRYILSQKILVSIGIISYPLYLWHWPILSLFRIIQGESLSPGYAWSGLGLAFIFSVLTYFLLEKPIRNSSNNNKIVFELLFGLTIVLCIGWIIFANDGVKNRYIIEKYTNNQDQLQWKSFTDSRCLYELGVKATFCLMYGRQSEISVAVLGDSTGNSLSPGLAEMLQKDGRGLLNVGHWTCPPIRKIVSTPDWGKWKEYGCRDIVNTAYNYVLTHPEIQTVILAVFPRDLKFWELPGVSANLSESERFEIFAKLLDSDIRALNAAGKNVVLTYDAPTSPAFSRDCFERPFAIDKTETCRFSEVELLDRQPYQNYFNSYFEGRTDICIFRQTELLIKNGILQIFDHAGNLMIRDTHHLSMYGSTRMAEQFIASSCFHSASK